MVPHRKESWLPSSGIHDEISDILYNRQCKRCHYTSRVKAQSTGFFRIFLFRICVHKATI